MSIYYPHFLLSNYLSYNLSYFLSLYINLYFLSSFRFVYLSPTSSIILSLFAQRLSFLSSSDNIHLLKTPHPIFAPLTRISRSLYQLMLIHSLNANSLNFVFHSFVSHSRNAYPKPNPFTETPLAYPLSSPNFIQCH